MINLTRFFPWIVIGVVALYAAGKMYPKSETYREFDRRSSARFRSSMAGGSSRSIQSRAPTCSSSAADPTGKIFRNTRAGDPLAPGSHGRRQPERHTDRRLPGVSCGQRTGPRRTRPRIPPRQLPVFVERDSLAADNSPLRAARLVRTRRRPERRCPRKSATSSTARFSNWAVGSGPTSNSPARRPHGRHPDKGRDGLVLSLRDIDDVVAKEYKPAVRSRTAHAIG